MEQSFHVVFLILILIDSSPRACCELSPYLSDGFYKLMEHQDGESQGVKAFQDFRRTLEIPSQAAEAGYPSKTVFDHPALR